MLMKQNLLICSDVSGFDRFNCCVFLFGKIFYSSHWSSFKYLFISAQFKKPWLVIMFNVVLFIFFLESLSLFGFI